MPLDNRGLYAARDVPDEYDQVADMAEFCVRVVNRMQRLLVNAKILSC